MKDLLRRCPLTTVCKSYIVEKHTVLIYYNENVI